MNEKDKLHCQQLKQEESEREKEESGTRRLYG